MVTTLIARRWQAHQWRLIEKARVDNPNFANLSNGYNSRADYFWSEPARCSPGGIRQNLSVGPGPGGDPGLHRYVYGSVCFAGVMFFMTFALKKNDPGGGGVRVAE